MVLHINWEEFDLRSKKDRCSLLGGQQKNLQEKPAGEKAPPPRVISNSYLKAIFSHLCNKCFKECRILKQIAFVCEDNITLSFVSFEQ
jgi:hypothetical protein